MALNTEDPETERLAAEVAASILAKCPSGPPSSARRPVLGATFTL